MTATRIVNHDLDLLGVSRIQNLPDATLPQQPMTLAQGQALINGLAWKDNVRVSPDNNINVNSPGATIDSLTMVVGDRILLRNQTAPAENGLYVYNGSSVPLTRSIDGDSFAELHSAVVIVDAGTNAGTQWRQTQINGTIGVSSIVWASMVVAVPSASETVQGIIEIATQAEVDGGTDTVRAVTPATLANWSNRRKMVSAVFGDVSTLSYTVTHNFNTRKLLTTIRQTSTPWGEVSAQVEATNLNMVTVQLNQAPGNNAYEITIEAL